MSVKNTLLIILYIILYLSIYKDFHVLFLVSGGSGTSLYMG